MKNGSGMFRVVLKNAPFALLMIVIVMLAVFAFWAGGFPWWSLSR